eukprot:GFUD01088595.1.p1 GENE.GFUD01088595.1~~GFUD01088595.1.p1  ORF type:complete len:235 (-),score=67.68 GFUD01088595.1:124-828(-)
MSFSADFTKSLPSTISNTTSRSPNNTPAKHPKPKIPETSPLPAQDDLPPTHCHPSLLLVHSTISDHTVTSSGIGKGQVEGNPYPAARKGLRCRSCHEEMSTKEALKLHTCYSIMDRTITTDGNTIRRRMVPGKLEIGQTSRSSRVKKNPVIKKVLSKKPKSNLLIKDQLLSAKLDPKAETPPKRHLAPEQEHGAGTLVVSSVRIVSVGHPVPLKWMEDRNIFQLQFQGSSGSVR